MSERDTIVKNLNEWASKLVAFDEAEKAEVYVWLLRDGEVAMVKVYCPDCMEASLKAWGHSYSVDANPTVRIHAKDEGVTWFRSEAGAEVRIAYNEVLKRDKAEEPDYLVSLGAAKARLRLNRVEVPYTKSTIHLAGQARRHNETVDELILALDRLPRYPAPKLNIMPGQAFELPPDWEPGDKLVSWEKVKGWFCNQYGDCYISDKFRKHLGIGPDE